MAFEPRLRTDILPEDLTEAQKALEVIVETQYNAIVRNVLDKSTTVHPAKNVFESMDLIQTVVSEYEEREDRVADARVIVTFDCPDEKIAELSQDTNPRGIISLSLERREPGAFQQGAPFEARVHNLKPILREEKEDPDNPGYRRAILGYYFDNVIRARCWARTNKMANELMIWFETVISEMTWWFRFSGIARILYWGLGDKKKIEIDGNKYYSHAIDYYIRTEKVSAISQKKFEKLIVRLQRIAPNS
jgi:hypothetical protein